MFETRRELFTYMSKTYFKGKKGLVTVCIPSQGLFVFLYTGLWWCTMQNKHENILAARSLSGCDHIPIALMVIMHPYTV